MEEGENLDESSTEAFVISDENETEGWTLMVDGIEEVKKPHKSSNEKSVKDDNTIQSTKKPYDSHLATAVSNGYDSDQDQPFIGGYTTPNANYIVRVEAEASGRDTIITIVQMPEAPSEYPKDHSKDVQQEKPQEVFQSNSKTPSGKSKGKRKRNGKRTLQQTGSQSSLETIPEQEGSSPTGTDVIVLSDSSTATQELRIFPKQKSKKRKRPPRILSRMSSDDPYRLTMEDALSPPSKKRRPSDIPLPVEEVNQCDDSVKEEAVIKSKATKTSVSVSDDEKHPLVIQPEPTRKPKKARPKNQQRPVQKKSPPPAELDSPPATTTMQEVFVKGAKQPKLMCVCVCGMMFSHRSGLSRHRRIKHLGMTYECLICNERFTRSDSLNDHMRRLKHHFSLPEQPSVQTRVQPGVAYAYKSAPQITIKKPHPEDGSIETIISRPPIPPTTQKESSLQKSQNDAIQPKSLKESLASKSPPELLIPDSLKETLQKSSKVFPLPNPQCIVVQPPMPMRTQINKTPRESTERKSLVQSPDPKSPDPNFQVQSPHLKFALKTPANNPTAVSVLPPVSQAVQNDPKTVISVVEESLSEPLPSKIIPAQLETETSSQQRDSQTSPQTLTWKVQNNTCISQTDC